jgi:mRNA interferase MazF
VSTNVQIKEVQAFLKWMERKFSLNLIAEKAKRRFVKRGQVYECELGVGIGSEMQKARPCVIIQNNIGNHKSGNTIVAPITHDSSEYPFLVPLTVQKDQDGTIILDGRVNVSNICCVSKARLGDYVTSLSPQDLKKVEIAVARSLDLMAHYNKLEKRLKDKLEFIDKIKHDRNKAQDYIKKLRDIAQVSTDEELEKLIRSKLTD